jgi:hypothetical protein
MPQERARAKRGCLGQDGRFAGRCSADRGPDATQRQIRDQQPGGPFIQQSNEGQSPGPLPPCKKFLGTQRGLTRCLIHPRH